jgi:uncharacterized repeat protein (TIGR02543 family)
MTMKRILALLMCLTMTLSLLPFSFAAEDPDSGEPTSVSETAAAAETGDPAPAEPAEPEAPAEPDPAPVAPTDQVELTEENTVPESAAPNLEQSPDPEPASAPQEESAQDEKQDNKIPFEHKKLKDKKNGVTITGMVPADAGIRFADVRDDLVPAPNMRDLKSGVKGLFRAPAQAETGSDSALGLTRDNVLAAYDLKLVDENGEAVLPDGKVTVTLDVSDLDLPENVRVLHYLDSAAAIEAALAAQKADPDHANRVDYVDDADLVENEVLADALAATREYTGDDEELGLYVETILPEVDGDTLSFETGSFSVYAVVGEGENARLVVKFMNGTTEIASMYVKKGDIDPETGEVDPTILYDPGAGSVEGANFYGWTTNANYTPATEGLTIDNVRDDVKTALSAAGGVTDGTEIVYYAMWFKSYIVRYLDYYDVSLGTDQALYRADAASTEANYTVNMEYTLPSEAAINHNFEGWRSTDTTIINAPDDRIYQNGTTITITGDVTFSVNAPAGNWLIFNENGKGATYNAAKFYKTGETTSRPRPDNEMLRNGYTFGGWYTDKDCTNGNEFTFGSALTANTTLYAKWNPVETANYTVIIWKQNVKGVDDGGHKLYDFEESIRLSGAPGTNVNTVTSHESGNDRYARVNNVNKQYTGFHLDRYDQNVTINAEGNTVVNVYYDRNEYTLSFQVQDYTYTQSNSNQNGYYYIPLASGGYERVYLYYWNGSWSIFNSNQYTNGATYTGLKYTRSNNQSWQTIKTITALYGQNIRNNFPIVGSNSVTYTGASWSSQGSAVFNDEAYVSYIDVMQAESTTFRLAYNPTGNYYTYHVKYYVEALPGDTDTVSFDGKTFVLYYDAEIHFRDGLYSTKSEEFTNITGYTQYGSYPAYDDEGHANFDSNRTISLYYTRNVYPILFMDGVYVDGNDNPVKDQPSMSQIGTVGNIAYGASTATYNSTKPTDFSDITTPAGYVFGGWYIDDACTSPYTFTDMPEGGITVYAKWHQIQYRVFLHPNAGTDSTLDWGNDSQAMNFRISYGGTVDTPNDGKRNNYELVGWFKDEDCTVPYTQYDLLNESLADYFTAYDKTATMTDVMDKYGNIEPGSPTPSGTTGPGYNSDAYEYKNNVFTARDRYWITQKLDLYALWRKDLNGADGIGILYDAGDHGINPPSDTNLYLDQARAVAGAAATANLGYEFDCWVLQRWDASQGENGAYVDTDIKVKPGEHFVVKLDDARDVVDTTGGTTTHQYTIRLMAKYVEKNTGTPTHITWYGNGGTADGGATQVSTMEGDSTTLIINKGYPIKAANTFTRPGYEFVGWARVKEDTPLENVADSDLWLKQNDAGTGWLFKDGEQWKATTGIYADEQQDIHKLVALWKEADVTINYAVGTAYKSMGSVSRQTETIKAATGPAAGSTATANAGYQFVGWYKDADYIEQITDTTWLSGNQITPQKEGGVYKSATYYAKFEPALSSLTITKTGDMPATENAVFTVKNGGTVVTTVTVPGNRSVTIDGLQIGTTYTVTEDPGWAWKYTPTYKVDNNERNTITISDNAADNVMMVSNTKKTGTTPNTNWLTAASSAVNRWVTNGETTTVTRIEEAVAPASGD